MKSLEYVKKIREDLNQCFRHWNPATMNNDNDFYHNEWETIKQDLEVLEIIRKKDVNLATLKLCVIRTDTIEQLLSKYNKSRYFTRDELTIEELLKLKQWLEGNEE